MRVSLGSQQTLYRAQLKISIPAGSTRYYIGKLFSSFAAKNPDISYDIFEIPSDFVIPNVLNGITEIGLIRSSMPWYSNLCVYPYEKEDIVAVIPKDHPLSGGHEPLQMADFTGHPLSVPFDILNIVYAAYAQQAVMPNVSVITSTNGTAVEWARTFNSIALVSCLTADRKEQQDMVIRKIDHESMYVMSVFLTHRDRKLSEQARMFLEEVGINGRGGNANE